jgi:hypothetical protein
MRTKLSFLFCLFSLLFQLSALAQTVKPDVISSAGGSFETTGRQVSWTLGEPAIAAYAASNAMLSQGFQQPEIIVESGFSDPDIQLSIKVYPVPAGNRITLEFSEIPEGLSVELYNLQGTRIYAGPVRSGNFQIDLKPWPASEYILKIVSAGKPLIQTYTIIKQ